MSYKLIKVESAEDWRSYHDIRRVVLFEGKGRLGMYDENYPDEYKPNHYPLLLNSYRNHTLR